MEKEEKEALVKLCKKLGGTMAKKNADAASVTLWLGWVRVRRYD